MSEKTKILLLHLYKIKIFIKRKMLVQTKYSKILKKLKHIYLITDKDLTQVKGFLLCYGKATTKITYTEEF